MSELLPCGLLGELRLYADQDAARTRLRAARAALGSERRVVAQYLAAGTVVFAIMDSPPDLLDPRVRIPGGSGVATDGEYFWLGVAAHYVATYGIALPPEFVTKAVKYGGVPPVVASSRLREIDRALIALM